jgi:acetyl/propionyl-CoA carboxylase alpha subunit/acetyl-CoA carboxylase carboxyltransferase component
MRLVHAVRELNDARDEPLVVIALYTEPERHAMFVREADEAVCIGPATFVDDGRAKNGYLDYAALERALVETHAEAVWVGWGFVAEHPDFVELCEKLGIVFVGPDSSVMRALVDKVSAKRLAEECGLPVAPWSGGAVDTVDEARRHAARIGLPLAIKATAGGGERGIRRVDNLVELDAAFERARDEALATFGDPTVFLERFLEGARHVEVQVIADGLGAVWAVGVRDCTLQRRHQKAVEESASTAFTDAQEDELRAAAVRLVRAAGYRNAATVEFLYQPDEKALSFIEVNARLQVEHPVTEVTTGLDLVKLQLHVAAGGALVGEPPPRVGHAIEVRLNAEDPERGFAPAPGRVELFRVPTGPGLRVDRGVAEGDTVSPEFDSMIAKLVAWGNDRDEALARLRRALIETAVVVRGGTTNKGFLLGLLDRVEVRTGEFDNVWLDGLASRGEALSTGHAEVAVLAAAVDAFDADVAVDQARFYGWARRGRPKADAPVGRPIDLRHHGTTYRVTVGRLGAHRYRAQVKGTAIDLRVERVGRFESRMWLGGRRTRVVSVIEGTDHLVEVDGVPHRVSRDDGGVVRAPAPSVVVGIPVAPGDEVAAGEPVAIVESMKLEVAVTAPFNGRVRDVFVGTNVQVDAGAALVRLEPLGVERGPASGDAIDFAAVTDRLNADAEPRARCRANLKELEALVLGYDVDAARARRLLDDQEHVCATLVLYDPDMLEGERRVLRAFADLRVLFRVQHDPGAEERVRSPQEYLFAFLRSLDVVAEGIPRRFVEQFQVALAHYGVRALERGPDLEAALYRIFVSQQRLAPQVEAVLAILDRRLEHAETFASHEGSELREVLDHLIDATRAREPVVADLARELRFRAFDEPMLEHAAAEVYGRAEAELVALAAEPDEPERAVLVDALVACPQPLAPLLTSRIHTTAPALRRAMLEVMTRRYYRIRPLEHFAAHTHGDFDLVTADFEYDGGRVHVLTTHLDLADLRPAAEAVAAQMAGIPAEAQVMVDFYARGEVDDANALAARLAATLRSVEYPHEVRRFVVVVSGGEGTGIDAVTHFTYRRVGDALAEDEVLRGLHPMMAERLQLWRFADFRMERLPSARDVYLFRGVARENERDERLFAIAEVRDLTPVRDSAGRAVALPELERMFAEALEGIRRVQAHRPPARRLHWNRVLLYVWPAVELRREEIEGVGRRLAPSGAGLGIEALLVRCRLRERPDQPLRDCVVRLSSPGGSAFVMEVSDPPTDLLRPLDEYTRKIVDCRRRGVVYPYELLRVLAPARPRDELPAGDFVEHDLDVDGKLVPVDRPAGRNEAGVVVGVTRSFTERYPEGITRVTILGDPTRALGSIAEPECRRIIAALDLAAARGVPVEWFALSAGAKIALDSGTENMDWIAAVLRRLIEFTQARGEVNVVVAGINVGAQPYWNAEATMLMHTQGILVMTPQAAMVLTGKQALDYSGGVSADDNDGIGGYERIMGPNGQAQYWAADLPGACRVLLRHYEHAYVAPGERFPRRAATSDTADRDPGIDPHALDGSDFRRVGDVFSDATNPERKKPFDVRTVMRAAIDRDHPPLERWLAMRDAETAVVWDAHLGGNPVALIGIESHTLPRYGLVPADGPDRWTSGTLFPQSSRKIARAVNAASGSRPLVVLANLSGFDGSPESMRSLQLEYGAEIGRAVVNFDGPIVLCVISRFHGGAYVVFSRRLNDQLETVALEGSRASVIGGAPAAAVVFAHEVDVRTRDDQRVRDLVQRLDEAEPADRATLRAELTDARAAVHSEKLGELAAEFDRIHSVERALEVGSMDRIIPARDLRRYLVEAVERGIQRATERE